MEFLFIRGKFKNDQRNKQYHNEAYDCAKVINAQSEEEILQQAAVPAKQEHRLEVTPQLAEQIRTLIKEERPSA